MTVLAGQAADQLAQQLDDIGLMMWALMVVGLLILFVLIVIAARK